MKYSKLILLSFFFLTGCVGAGDLLLFKVNCEILPETFGESPRLLLIIKNVDARIALKGELYLSSPKGLTLKPEMLQLSLKPGDSRKIEIVITQGNIELKKLYKFKVTCKARGLVKTIPVRLDLTRYRWCGKAKNQIKIDGEMNDWKKRKTMPIDRIEQVVNPAVDKDDISEEEEKLWKKTKAYGYVGWDDKNLYILVNVIDSVISNRNKKGRYFLGDSTEIFLDMRTGKEFGKILYSKDIYQLIFNATNHKVNAPYDIYPKGKFKSPIEHVSKMHKNGYIFECRIPFCNFSDFKPYSGNQIGFNFAVNQGDVPGVRDFQIMWMEDGATSFKDASKFGILVLTD